MRRVCNFFWTVDLQRRSPRWTEEEKSGERLGRVVCVWLGSSEHNTGKTWTGQVCVARTRLSLVHGAHRARRFVQGLKRNNPVSPPPLESWSLISPGLAPLSAIVWQLDTLPYPTNRGSASPLVIRRTLGLPACLVFAFLFPSTEPPPRAPLTLAGY